MNHSSDPSDQPPSPQAPSEPQTAAAAEAEQPQVTAEQAVQAINEVIQREDGQPLAAEPRDTATIERKTMLETIHLRKEYGRFVAVHNLNLKVLEGDLFGFIGPNGAGKTTTIKVLATLLRPTHGDAMVGGFSVRKHAHEIRHLIGYMPDSFGTYEEMRVTEYLDFFAAAYRVPNDKRGKLIADVLDLTDLSFKRDAFVKGLSRGMQQRLGVARVLLHDPKVLLLDEPASGLDPRARIEMRALLKELQKMGKTILISSHILTELAEMCNAIGIIERGELLYQGPVRDIVQRLRRGGSFEIKVNERHEEAIRHLERHPDVLRANADDDEDGEPFLRVKLIDGRDDPSPLATLLIEKGFKLRMLKEEDVNLEDVFLQVTKGAVQ